MGEQIKKVMNSGSAYMIHCEILSHVTLRNTLWNNSLRKKMLISFALLLGKSRSIKSAFAVSLLRINCSYEETTYFWITPFINTELFQRIYKLKIYNTESNYYLSLPISPAYSPPCNWRIQSSQGDCFR